MLMEMEVKGKGLMPEIKARAKTAVKGGLYVFKGNFPSTVVLVIASITIARMLGLLAMDCIPGYVYIDAFL
jgi:hypothetical protein